MRAFKGLLARGAACMGLSCVAAPALAATDAVVAHALQLESGGRMAEAYALLAPLVASRAGDPDFDYVLGLAAADSGHGAAAILAFQRVLAVQPGNAQARAEIARAYALSGDVDSARAQFDTVLDDPSVPDPVRQRFNRIVRDLDRTQRGGGTSVSGFLDASGGYDSNINTATQLTSITLPLFAGLGPASLSGGATRQDSGFYETEGGVSVQTGLSRQTRGFASVLGSFRDNLTSHPFDQATATGTAGLAHNRANHDVVSFSGQYQPFWLGGDRYRAAWGTTAQYTHLLSGGRALSLSAQWFRLDYHTDNLRDANRYSLGVSYVGRTALLSLAGGKEQVRDGVSDNLSNAFLGARASIEKPIGKRFALIAGAGFEHRWNDAADPLFLEKRRDDQLDLSAGLKVLISKSAYVRPRVTYTRNFSDIDLHDYRRFTASLGLRADF